MSQSSSPVIEVHQLSKRYRMMSSPTERLNSVQAIVLSQFRKIWELLHLIQQSDAKWFWALKQVSFNIWPGQTVALLGHNGAGKTTLLRILGCIGEPSEGHILVRGRLGSFSTALGGLLGDLSGRENVFYVGSLFGMSQTEIQSKMEAILAYAEIGPFAEAQLSQYSFGMRMRLAFSILLHQTIDILVIDEGLAGLDEAFQKKVLDRLFQLKQEGKTLLLVTHETSQLNQFCDRGLLLHQGQLVQDGPIEAVIEAYRQDCSRPRSVSTQFSEGEVPQ